MAATAVAAPPATEKLVYKWTAPVTEAEMGFPRYRPPMANGNWRSPINFADGTFHIRVLIKGQPVPQDMKLQFCVWQFKRADQRETCTQAKVMSGRAGSFATWSQTIPSMWKKKGIPIIWTQPRLTDGFAIKNMDMRAVSNHAGWNWHGEDPKKWFPILWDATVVVVAKGAVFGGWQNYPLNNK